MRKLTLSAEPELIQTAKRLAGARGTSVSGLFSQFIRSLANPEPPAKKTPRTRMATGLVKLPKGKNPERLIEEAMAERYLR